MQPSLLSRKPIALGSLSTLILSIALIAIPALAQGIFSIYAVVMRTNIDLLFYSNVMSNMVWINAIPPVIGGVLLCFVASRFICAHFKVDVSKTKRQFIHLSSWVLIASIVIGFFAFLSIPTSHAMNTATTGYILDTPVSDFDYLIGNYSDSTSVVQHIYAINGSNWDNLVSGVGSTSWSSYTANYSKIEELALSALSTKGGVVLCKNVAFNLALMGSIPVNVTVICKYGSQEYAYINPASSAGSPYTVSVGQGLNGGYYTAEDCQNRIAFTSTNASYVGNSVVPALSGKGGEIVLGSGNFSVDSPMFAINNFVSGVGSYKSLTIRGQGDSTVLKAATGCNSAVITVNQSNCLSFYDFTVDSNVISNYGIYLRADPTVMCGHTLISRVIMHQSKLAEIGNYDMSFVKIEHCSFGSDQQWAINSNGTQTKIEYCIFGACALGGVAGGHITVNALEPTVANSYFELLPLGASIQLGDNAHRATITENDMYGATTAGTIGISLTDADADYAIISNNHIKLYETAIKCNVGGLFATITGNTIEGSTSAPSGSIAINLNFAGYTRIESNYIFMYEVGIRIHWSAAYGQNLIIGNHILGYSAGAKQPYGVIEYTTDYNTIEDNYFGLNTNPVTVTGAHTIVRNNQGFITEATIQNIVNSTATTLVFNHDLYAAAESVQCTFNVTGITYTWTSNSTAVTVTVDPTLADGTALPAAYKIIAADVKFVP